MPTGNNGPKVRITSLLPLDYAGGRDKYALVVSNEQILVNAGSALRAFGIKPAIIRRM